MTKLLGNDKGLSKEKINRNSDFMKKILIGILFPFVLLVTVCMLLKCWSNQQAAAIENITINWGDCRDGNYGSELEFFLKRLIWKKKFLKEPRVACLSDSISNIYYSKLNVNNERVVSIIAEENENENIKKLIVLFESKPNDYNLLYPVIDCVDCERVCFYDSYENYKQVYNVGANKDEIVGFESNKDIYIVIEGLDKHNVFKI